MARRAVSNDSPVSLFPFLSILACMIGTLTLMITGLALTGMDSGGEGQEEDAVQRAEAYVVLKRKRAEYQSQIDVLRQVKGDSANLDKTLSDARQEVKTLELATKSEAERQKVEADLQRQADASQASASTANAEKVNLEKTLKALREELVRSQQTLSEATVKVLPPRNGRPIKYKPYFAEATKQGVVLYDGKAPRSIGVGAIGKDKALNDLLTRLSGKANEQLVVLIRHDGLSARNRLITLARERNVTFGQIPLVGDGRLDLKGVKP
jgi:hypothetical protein